LGRDLKYPTLELGAAALLHSLVHNHPFHNGNKRTALVSCLVFLDVNGASIKCTEDELFKFMMDVGAHRIFTVSAEDSKDSVDYADQEVWAIAQWVHGRVYRKTVPSRYLKFRELRSILQKYGCELGAVSGGYINIQCGGRKTQVWYGGEGREVDISTIKKIRHDLHLDEQHGCDTAMFYNADGRLPHFITRYRKTLDLLARE
jgi:hypothetical protein